jgi:hypothetical protein
MATKKRRTKKRICIKFGRRSGKKVCLQFAARRTRRKRICIKWGRTKDGRKVCRKYRKV